jgi:hypothetical protein
MPHTTAPVRLTQNVANRLRLDIGAEFLSCSSDHSLILSVYNRSGMNRRAPSEPREENPVGLICRGIACSIAGIFEKYPKPCLAGEDPGEPQLRLVSLRDMSS